MPSLSWLFGGGGVDPSPVTPAKPPVVPPVVAPPSKPPMQIASTHYSVMDYGAKGDGSHDDTAAINAAIAAAHIAGGGTVYFGPGNYKITSTLVMQSRVNLLGEGTSRYEVQPPPTSQITWGGPAGDPMVDMLSTVNGITIHGLAFNGANSAGIGWYMQSVAMSLLQHVQIADCTQYGIHIDMPVDAPLDCTGNTFQNLQIICKNGTGIKINATKGNACHNTFSNLFIVHGNRALDIDWSDNNDFIQVYCYSTNGLHADVLLGPVSTSNRFWHLEGIIEAMTKETPDSRYANEVYGYDQSNGQPPPIVHPNAFLHHPQMVPYST